MQQKGQCECGMSRFSISGEPLVRVICHCEICQQFNQASFSDVVVYRSEDTELHNIDTVEFQTYRSPPAVQRGRCVHCSKPAIEYLHLPILPALTIIPSSNLAQPSTLPEPVGHIFYHRRQDNVSDGLPKYNGYMLSQLILGWHIAKALLRSK